MKKHFYLAVFITFYLSSNGYGQAWQAGSGSLNTSPNTTKIGIGVSSPQALLHLLKSPGSTSGKGLLFGYNGNDIQGRYGTTGQFNGDLILNYWSGNVGIGTTSPTQKLDVNGNAVISGNLGIGTTSPGSDLEIYESINRGFKFWNDLNINYQANITEFETFGTRSGVLQFYQPRFANGEEPLGGWTQLRCGGIYVIHQPQSTHPGIGAIELAHGDIILRDKDNTSCNGYDCYNIELKNNGDAKFRGKITAEEIEVKANVWSDHVFKPGYNLRSIGEVEEFIKTNNHLPEVPSENEVMDNGINLGDMDAILLKKIEELTLYIIEQQKEISTLKSEVQSLKE